MEATRTDREKYAVAKAHVRTLKVFYSHLIVFIVVLTVLLAVDYSRGSSWWVQWPFIGWGLGLLGHAFLVFSPSTVSTRAWEERKIKEEIAKM